MEQIIGSNRPSNAMTTKEMAIALNVSQDSILRAAKELFPGKIENGKSASFDETEATAIKLKIGKHHNLRSTAERPKTELEKELLIAQAMQFQHEKIERLAAENAIMAPKAKVYDQIADSHGTKPLQELAKILGIGPKTIFATLRGLQILYVDNGKNLPHQRYIDSGYFVVKEEPYAAGGVSFVHPRIFVTAKGELWLAKKLGETE